MTILQQQIPLSHEASLSIGKTNDGRVFRTLNILNEHSRKCLAKQVRRKLNSVNVIYILMDLFILRGVPQKPTYASTTALSVF